MRAFILLMIAICAITASLTQDFSNISQKWTNFKATYNKVYKSRQEELFRKIIFLNNLQRIAKHNARYHQGLETYEMCINKFIDFTEEELMSHTHGFNVSETEPDLLHLITSVTSWRLSEAEIPDSLDWRDKGVVTEVKDQGKCGSCWAIAATGALEAQVAIHTGTKVTLSEQQLVDCLKESYGCKSGSVYKSFKYIIENGGVNYDTDYPYKARQGKCRYDQNKPTVIVRDYGYHLGISETDLKNLVATQGPVAAGIYASADFHHYHGGVFYSPNCPKFSVNHDVLIVGYGNERGLDYWLVKNSWGANWGLEGYIKIARNWNNHCGIASYITYPLL